MITGIDKRWQPADVSEQLHRLQYGHGTGILLFSQDPVGLGGQISRRLLGLKLALLLQRKVVFPHLEERPYAQVFERLHFAADYKELESNAVPFSHDALANNEVVKLDYWDISKDIELSRALSERVPDFCKASTNPELHFDGCLLAFCKLLPRYLEIIEEKEKTLLIAKNTLGVHVRRGDKSVETPFLPIGLINQNISRLCAERSLNRVFVSSDDQAIFSEIRVPSGVEMVFDEMEKRYNNANHKFLLRFPSAAVEETETSIKNIYLLGRCGAVLGQDNAHFARLAAAMISFSEGGAPFGTLLDGSFVIRNSVTANIWFAMRLRLRSVAKFMFPWLTLRAIKKRL